MTRLPDIDFRRVEPPNAPLTPFEGRSRKLVTVALIVLVILSAGSLPTVAIGTDAAANETTENEGASVGER
jgi:hypothetical protein